MISGKTTQIIFGIVIASQILTISILATGQRNTYLRTQVRPDTSVEPGEAFNSNAKPGLPWPTRREEFSKECCEDSSSQSPRPDPSSSGVGRDMADCQIALMSLCGQLDSYVCDQAPDIPDEDLERMSTECKEENPNDLFAQISCAEQKLRGYFDSTSHDECCSDFAQGIHNLIPELDSCDATITSNIHAFTWCSAGESHAVNRIKICPTRGPNAGECFEYIYDAAGWSPNIFFPYDEATQRYHQQMGHQTRMPDICGPPPSSYEIALYTTLTSVTERDPGDDLRITELYAWITPKNQTGGPITVNVKGVDGTAVMGEDYELDITTLVIPDGRSSSRHDEEFDVIDIPIIADYYYEEMEKFSIDIVSVPELDPASFEAFGAVVKIYDDDRADP